MREVSNIYRKKLTSQLSLLPIFCFNSFNLKEAISFSFHVAHHIYVSFQHDGVASYLVICILFRLQKDFWAC